VVRYRYLPLTQALIGVAARIADKLRQSVVLSLGLDFHPSRHPRLPPFAEMHRAGLYLLLAAMAVLPAQGVLLDTVGALHVRGLYTVYCLALGGIWVVLLLGLAVQFPAIVLDTLEVVKGRLQLTGMGRISIVVIVLTVVATLLVLLDQATGLTGCMIALGFACVLPSVLRPIEPARGPWLNLAVGPASQPRTARLSDVVTGIHRLMALETLVVVALLVPSSAVVSNDFPVTELLLRVYGWSAAWLLTGGAVLAVAEFNRRRRLGDPAFERERVLWALPGPEAAALELERFAIERAGWTLVVSARLPATEDADLLVGVPDGLTMPGSVPTVKVPPALFVLADNPGRVLSETDERDKSGRAKRCIEQLLTAARPQLGDRGEGTFLVPHCWLVVGLTRDDDRASLDRPPAMTFGQSYQSVMGTRLRRFLNEVMGRAGIDVLYIEDSVRSREVGDVMERIFEHHIRRTDPAELTEADFLGLQGLRIVLHDVDPEVDGIPGVDSHVTRNAISRARILIIGRDKGDDDDDDRPPAEGESSDWLRESLRNLFPRLQHV
jgi:hypothetical protein